MARRKLKLTMDLVPKSCWYQSLYRLLPRSQWNKLREGVLTKARNRCQICRADGKLYCHEIWHYDDKKHIQSLKGFHVVCSLCHHLSHFGKAQDLADQGLLDLDAVIQHFLSVNKVGVEIFEEHEKDAFTTWRERSRRRWRTVYGKYARLIPKKNGA